MRLSLSLLTILGLATSPALASQPAPVCAGIVAPPAELAGWSHPSPLAAGMALVPGSARIVPLAPVGTIHFPVPLGRTPEPADKGGLLTIAVTQPGTYRIALGSAAWIDVVRGTTSVPSMAHAHGPDCTGIRKMVNFPLVPGTYGLQISSAAVDALPVMIVRLP